MRCDSFSASSGTALLNSNELINISHAVYKDCLVSMESVLSLFENEALRSVDYIFCNLISAVSGEAVEEHSILVSYAHDLAVNLVVLEDLNSLSLLSFLTH